MIPRRVIENWHNSLDHTPSDEEVNNFVTEYETRPGLIHSFITYFLLLAVIIMAFISKIVFIFGVAVWISVAKHTIESDS